MKVKGMVTGTPGNCTVFGSDTVDIGLTINTGFHNVVTANGTCFNNNICDQNKNNCYINVSECVDIYKSKISRKKNAYIHTPGPEGYCTPFSYFKSFFRNFGFFV